MNGEALSTLLQLAAATGAVPIDRWAKTSVRISDAIDIAVIRRVAAIRGLSVVGYFGDTLDALVLDERPPAPSELEFVSPLAPNERVASELRSARSGIEVAEGLFDQLAEIEVTFERAGWIRTNEAFLEELDRDWVAIAEGMTTTVSVGNASFQMTRVDEVVGADRPPVYVPVGEPGEGELDVWRGLRALADAASWLNLAHSVARTGGGVRVALIRDEPPIRTVTPVSSDGGSELLQWVVATGDANRREALDYVLMLVTASSGNALPSAVIVKRLAERQRIALTREQAAEVQRAITDGQRDTADALNRASTELGSLIEDTTKNANAAIVAVLGLVAFLAQKREQLPGWLVVAATLVAVAGIAVVVVSRWKRIGDFQVSIRDLGSRLERDPLLPQDDRQSALQAIEGFGVESRVKQARTHVVVLGLAAGGIALVAAGWLAWGSS